MLQSLRNSTKEYCKKCGEKYENDDANNNIYWCRPCQIDILKGNFTNWTSGNEKIDNFIQEMQLNIDHFDDIILEWIPYNQFNDIKEIGTDSFATVYSAIWKDGPLKYIYKELKYIRESKKIVFKCLPNSQNNINELLNEV